MAKRPTNDERFIKAVKAMERRTRSITAAAVIDPMNTDRTGRVVIYYGSDGGSVLNAIAWLPGHPDTGPIRHAGRAKGYGYDKATAAMGGAQFVRPDGTLGELLDQGFDWRHQLEKAGFIVIQTV